MDLFHRITPYEVVCATASTNRRLLKGFAVFAHSRPKDSGRSRIRRKTGPHGLDLDYATLHVGAGVELGVARGSGLQRHSVGARAEPRHSPCFIGCKAFHDAQSIRILRAPQLANCRPELADFGPFSVGRRRARLLQMRQSRGNIGRISVKAGRFWANVGPHCQISCRL